MKKLQLETTETSTKRPMILAAANIRKELKFNYPEVKFSVTCSGGSVRISWEDGTTTTQVEKISNMYKAGRFDGMTDMYEYDKDQNDSFGSSQYIFTSRDYSHLAYIECINEVTLYDNEEIETYTNNAGEITGFNIHDYHTNNRFNDFMRTRDYRLSLEEQKAFNEEKEKREEEEYQAQKIKDEKETRLRQIEHKARMKKLNAPVVGSGACPVLGSFLTLRYANLNKNETLGEYRDLVAGGDYYAAKSKIEKIVMLSNEKFDLFAVSLMDGTDFLGSGGTTSDDTRLEDLPGNSWEWTEEQQEIFRRTCFNMVTAIVAPNRETFYVDAQGYKYARYVALAA